MWMKMQRMVAAMLMVAALGACGPSGTSSPGRGNARLLTAEELSASPTTNLFDVVQRLRPAWLTTKFQGGSRGYPAIFVGSQRAGDINYLRTINTDNVLEVRYFDPIDASSRFGRNVPFGVMQITLDIGG
ncbi:hypothetical protein [Longimicrobium sp.]|uniref:hypothetical protein n=1 Tax=Longimicrobium sp. TaxID=2029185 RepID=UPI003B3AF1C5